MSQSLIYKLGLELQARVAELENLAYTAYCAGYGLGHNDTVEGHHAPPEEYPDEWADKRKELLADLLTAPEKQE